MESNVTLVTLADKERSQSISQIQNRIRNPDAVFQVFSRHNPHEHCVTAVETGVNLTSN
ncbi:hypothetical protein [Undibacterium sp. Xuan67W]|uniref:hypothetical protein n=1 Tax=Undibacterium sp. Xuan67W TaxID=3413057 RepID=UPI003BF317CD